MLVTRECILLTKNKFVLSAVEIEFLVRSMLKDILIVVDLLNANYHGRNIWKIIETSFTGNEES